MSKPASSPGFSLLLIINRAGPYYYTALTTKVITQHQQDYPTVAHENIYLINYVNSGTSFSYQSLIGFSKEGGIASEAHVTQEQQFDAPSSIAAEPDLEPDIHACTMYWLMQESSQRSDTMYYDVAYIGAQFDVTAEAEVVKAKKTQRA